MSEQFGPIQALLDRVRARWRRLVLLDATMRAAAAVAVIVVVALALSVLASRAPLALVLLGGLVVLVVAAAIVWAAWPVRHRPSDRMVARFIEERTPTLDERLVSAVDVVTGRDADDRPALATAMVRDAAIAASVVDPSAIVTDDALRRGTLRAAAACAALVVALLAGRHAARQTLDAATLLLFPSHVTLDVTPGTTRVQSGTDLTIAARLVGNTAPVIAQLLQAPPDSDDWRPAEMEAQGDGRFRLTLSGLSHSFRYKVLAGAAASSVFDVAVVRAPRVARIDVAYSYPPALGLASRVEEDGGDIYGPEGTTVTVTVHADAPVANGQMVLGPDQTLGLNVASPTTLTGSLQIAQNGSYRVALANADGMKSQGDTEYFIRILDDRPPEVHIVRPASDRRVTRLEEVEIAAEAQDDFGVSSLDLVYAVRGGPEHVVPLRIPPHSTSVTGRHLMYLEDIDVAPGDFISYYVRARDLPRGKQSSESRSDIFFLEVKPFEEEFTLAQTQAAQGGGSSGNPQLDDLVNAQKEIIVATWKLDRRSRDAQGAKSEQDIRTVAKSESELKLRVEQTASSFRENTMRDPRRSRTTGTRPGTNPQPPQPAPGNPAVGQTMAEEDAMTTASTAMGKAVDSLNALNTATAMPPEMEALNALLKAQADVKKRQIQRQQAASGAGQNRSTEDLSSLFDKELAKNQQTNYETKTSAEQQDDKNASTIDRVRDLARRQDELVRKQQDLARNQSQMSAEEIKRQLDSLTREQNDLRDKAEDVAKQLQQQGGQQQGQQGGQQGQSGEQGQKSQSGQPSGQPGQSAGQQGQAGQSGERRPGNSQNARAGSQGAEGQQGQEMRGISDEMRSAANDLRRQDAGQASARGAQALDRLRELEQQLQGGTAEGRRRALGDLQLEARQLADQERQLASEASRAREGQAGNDALRRLAGEQDRLAERLQRVQEGLNQQAASGTNPRAGGSPGTSGVDASRLQQAASDAAKDLQNQRLTERMQQSAEAMRRAATSQPTQSSSSASTDGPPSNGTPTSGTPIARPGAQNQAGAQQELARALDRLADRLNLVESPQDDESRRMTDQVARARDLRERMDDLTRQLQELDQQASGQARGQGQPSTQAQGRTSSPNQQPGQGQGGASGDPATLDRLRADIDRQMKEVRQLLADAQKANARSEGGPGSTFEGQGMVLSAPGTQGFKQDFAKWQELTRQVTLALDNVESSLSKKLQEKGAKDRLASGGDERAPAEYEQQVDAYFKALAARKRP